MSNDVSRDTIRGLLIEDPRTREPAALWAAESAYTQAGARVGPAEDQGASVASLVTTGDANGLTGTVEIHGHRSGLPGASSGGYVWKQSAEADTLKKGQEPPTAIRGFEAIAQSSSVGIKNETPDTVITPSGHIIVAGEVAVSGVSRGVSVRRRHLTDTAWTTVSLYSVADSLTYGTYPTVYTVPRIDGNVRVICHHWVEDYAGTGTANVRMHYSDDNGETWTMGASSTLTGTTAVEPATGPGINIASVIGSGNPGWTPKWLRARHVGGSVVLFMELLLHDSSVSFVVNHIVQWVSVDQGASFTIVDEATGSVAPGTSAYRVSRPALTVSNGEFLLAYITQNDSVLSSSGAAGVTLGVGFRRIASAGTPFTQSELITVVSKVSASGLRPGDVALTLGGGAAAEVSWSELAIFAEPSGRLHVYVGEGLTTNSGHEIYSVTSFDGGHTWTANGYSQYGSGRKGFIWDVDSGVAVAMGGGGAAGDTSFYPRDVSAIWECGRVVFVSRWAVPGATTDDSLTALHLGGYSNHSLARAAGASADNTGDATGWGLTWLPLTEPQAGGGWWVETTAGAPTTVPSSGGMTVVTAIGESDYWTATTGGTLANGNIGRAVFSLDSGGNVSSDTAGITVRLADGTNDAEFQIRTETSRFRIRDINGATNKATISRPMTAAVELEWAMNVTASGVANLTVWYRARSNATAHNWTVAYSGTIANDTATPNATSFVRFGNGVNTGTAASTTWYEFMTTTNGYTGLSVDNQAAGQSVPGGLWAVPYAPSPQCVVPGLSITTRGGPAIVGDRWNVTTGYHYAIDRIFPSVASSPSVGWRSTNETQHTIAFALDPVLLGAAGDMSKVWSDMFGLHVAGTNIRTGTLQGYQPGTGWVSISAFDSGIEVKYTTGGNTLRPGVLSNRLYHRLDEFSGSYVDLGSGKLRQITGNRDGVWYSSGIHREGQIVFSGADGTEPASGTGYIVPRAFTLLVVDSLNYSGYRIVADAQTTPDGYFEIGSIVLGPVVAFGMDYSWGRILETEANVSLTTMRNGHRIAYRRGDPRRRVEFAWTDGVDVTQIDTATPSPDYLMPSSTGGVEPIASERDMPYQTEGLIRMLDGPRRPVVYLPKIAKGTPDTQTFSRRHEAVYGRIVTPARIEQIQGEESTNEVFRVATMAIEEEV